MHFFFLNKKVIKSTSLQFIKTIIDCQFVIIMMCVYAQQLPSNTVAHLHANRTSLLEQVQKVINYRIIIDHINVTLV